MNIIDPGHTYEVKNVGEGTQKIFFIKKEKIEGSHELQIVQDGTTNEELIAVLIDRLYFLDNEFPSDYNKEAIRFLGLALNELHTRTDDRIKRGVEGTHNQ